MKRYLAHAILAVCLVTTYLVYAPGTSGYFLFDDTINIVENNFIRIQSLDFNTLRQAAFSGDAGLLGRPLSVVSFAVNYYFSGLNPSHLKLTNIVIHLINGILIFVLSYLIVDNHLVGNESRSENTSARWISLAVAATWLLHPFNLTSVLYIVQRMTSLAAMFVLLGIISFIHGRRRMMNATAGASIWVIASFVLFTPLAAFSKENGALLPCYLLLVEALFFRLQASTISAKRLLIGLFGFAVFLPLIAITLHTTLHPSWILRAYEIRDFTLSERLMTEARILWYYVQLILVPDITHMGMYHDDIPISRGLLSPPTTLVSVLGILSIAIAAILSAKRQPIAAFGILFFLVGHSLESSVLALELAHEHRNYLPGFGLLLILIYYSLSPLAHRQSLILRTSGVLLFIFVLSGVTFLRASQWGDPVLFKQKEVIHHPNSVRANIAMAAFYEELPPTSTNEAEEYYRQSYEHYVKAATASPSDTLGLFGLVALNSRHSLPIDESWIRVLAKRIEFRPFAPSTGNSLARLEKCVSTGICKIPEQAMTDLFKAALRNSTLQGKSRIQVLFSWSNFLFNVSGNRNAAADVAFLAANSDPNNIDSQITLISLLINMAMFDDARVHILLARRLNESPLVTTSLDSLESILIQRMDSHR